VDRLRLAHAAGAVLALGQLTALGADQLGSALAQAGRVLLRRRMLPHANVHGRGREDRAAESERRLREHVVGEPVRELRQRVGRERRDHQEVGVGQMRIEVAGAFAPREGLEGMTRDEPFGVGREERRHLVPVLHEQPQELARLVGGDTAGHAEENPRHAGRLRATCTRR
jgi:hypothetical protein